MPNERKCPDCGAEIPAGAPLGFCPQCELTAATRPPGESPESPPLGPSGSTQAPMPEGALRYFGDYELLQVLGQGGMGVVYKARQLSLNRIVALKMTLGGRQASASEVQRFRHEAESAARLRHPNIVSIHEVGEHDGQHYFSMDYVEGQDLAALVRVSPLPAARAARYVQIIAEAIHFAHQKGVLHRDLKPSNVLIDLDDQPRVTDFGLAKRIKGDSDLTQTGQVLGAPSFIPPEQAAGHREAMGPHGDVYALGAILYHLLTGRPPFAAETITATLAQVLNNEPAAPRTLNATIPRDLETISLKCLEKDPDRRYHTAKDLADELGRFLRGEPILARPIGRMAKIGRWCRRNPAVAALSLGVLLLFVAGSIGSSIFTIQLSAALKRAEKGEKALQDSTVALSNTVNRAEQETIRAQNAETQALDKQREAEAARAEAVSNRVSAVEALAGLKVSERSLRKALEDVRNQKTETEAALTNANYHRIRAETNALGLEKLMRFVLLDLGAKLKPLGRVDLLQSVAEEATNYYGLTSSNRDPAGRLYAFKNLGQALALKGKSTGALEAFQIALANARQLVLQQTNNTIGLTNAKLLVQPQTNNTTWRLEELLCHQSIGDIWRAQGDSQRALGQYQAGLAIAKRLAAEHPEEMEWQRLCLAGHVKIGDLFWMRGDKEKALTNYISAVSQATNLANYSNNILTNLPADAMDARVQTLKSTTAWQRDLSASYSPVGRILINTWGWSNAYAGCTLGLTSTRTLSKQRSDDHQLQSHLALCYDNLGDVLFYTNQFREAQTNYEEARKIRQSLTAEDPANTEWQHDLLRSHQKLTRVVAAQGTKYKAWAVARVVADAPFGGLWRALKTYYLDVENVLIGGSTAAALADSSYSTNVARRLTASDPGNTDWQESLAQTYSALGDLLQRAGKRASARSEYERALDVRKALAAGDTNSMERQLRLAVSYGKLASALKLLSVDDAALACTRNNLGIFVTLFGQWPRNFLFLEGPSRGEKNMESRIGKEQPLTRQQIRDVGAIFSKAFSRAHRATQKPTASVHDWASWGNYCLEKAAVECLFGDIENAVSYAEMAVGAFEHPWHAEKEDPAARAQFRQALVSLGIFQIGNGRFTNAIQTANRGVEVDPTGPEFQAILALSYFGTTQYDMAVDVLRGNKGLGDGRGFQFLDAVLADLRRLRSKGWVTIDVDGIEQLVRAALADRATADDQPGTLNPPSAGGGNSATTTSGPR